MLLVFFALAISNVNELPKFMGVSSCASAPCHGSMAPLKGTNILRNELTTWKRHDAHSRAYQVLLSDRSKRMGEHLGIAQPEKAPGCLVCHSTPAIEDLRSTDFRLSDGVSCEACHGAAEFYLKPHVNGSLKPGEAGLQNLSDPQTLAKVCMDCHEGTKNVWVSHRLYGAGHPRLTFELDSYLANQPPHFRVDDDYRRRKGAPSAALRLIFGLIERADRQTQKPKEDFSSLYCFSCHHSLKENEWSFKRYGGHPGRPRLNQSSALLLARIVKTLDEAKGTKMFALVNSEKREELSDFLADLRKSWVSLKVTEPQTRMLLREILEFGAKSLEAQDYEVAEQVAMATSSLLAELSPNKQIYLGEVQRIFKALDDPAHFQPKPFREACWKLAEKFGS